MMQTKSKIEAVMRALDDLGEVLYCRGQIEAALKQTDITPAAYVNRDELDDMLGDRTATIQGTPSGFRATPLYLAPFVEASDLGEADVWHEGSRTYYRAKLLQPLTPEEALRSPGDEG